MNPWTKQLQKNNKRIKYTLQCNNITLNGISFGSSFDFVISLSNCVFGVSITLFDSYSFK